MCIICYVFVVRKKLSKFSQHPNWKNASNYVAKRYMKEVPNEAYFDDVKLQMDSKLWGEEYSKLNIPKKVKKCVDLSQSVLLWLNSAWRGFTWG